MTTDTTESNERLTPRFLGMVVLSAVGIIALWVLTVTVTRPWLVEVVRGDISYAEPLALSPGEGFGALVQVTTVVPGITLIVAMTIFIGVILSLLHVDGKQALVLLPVIFLSVGFAVFSFISAVDGPVTSTGDPVVMEWAQGRYGVELVGDVLLENSPTLALDDGTTVTVTVVESSAGSSVILTGEELGELPVITP